MSRAALAWLWGSLLLHGGLLGFSRPWGEVERLPRARQQVEFELLAQAPPESPSELQRPPIEALPVAVPARSAGELSTSRQSAPRQSAPRQSAPRVLEPPQVQSLASRTEAVALEEPSEPTASEGAESAEPATPIAVETPPAASHGASDVPGPDSAQPGQVRVGSNVVGSAVVGSAAAAQDLAATRRSYLRALRERVLARRDYPHAAQRAGLQGTVCLRFSVNASGRLSRLSVTCEAAPEPLLQAALRAVHAAEPFGPLPSGLGTEVTVDLPLVFHLDAL